MEERGVEVRWVCRRMRYSKVRNLRCCFSEFAFFFVSHIEQEEKKKTKKFQKIKIIR